MHDFLFSSTCAELARDYLQRNLRLSVVRGLISPVHDAYGKKVHSYVLFDQTFKLKLRVITKAVIFAVYIPIQFRVLSRAITVLPCAS